MNMDFYSSILFFTIFYFASQMTMLQSLFLNSFNINA